MPEKSERSISVVKTGWGQWTCSKLSKPEFARLFMAEISDETYEQLRQILEKQNGKVYTLEEAKEIGNGLLNFYEVLISFDNEQKDSTIPST
jgi:hypothetical protein